MRQEPVAGATIFSPIPFPRPSGRDWRPPGEQDPPRCLQMFGEESSDDAHVQTSETILGHDPKS